jgi:23S rRNA-/tRNA-specific pseudouridylate synthase
MQFDSGDKSSELCNLTRIVDQNEAGTRLEKFICQNFRSVVISKKLCSDCFKRGEIFVNGKTAESTRILHEGDIINLQINKLALKKNKLEMPVTTVLEDEYLAVICKNAGVSVKNLQEGLAFVLDGRNGLIKEGKEYACINETKRAVNGLVSFYNQLYL